MTQGPKAPAGKWALYYGIHSRTFSSRDSANEPIICDSQNAARDEVVKLKNDYAQMGFRLWYANLYDDRGNMTPLHADHFI
jgi:hypothetical protein